MSEYEPVGKLPGKTKFSGTRRIATRASGFHVHKETTGGEFKYDWGEIYSLARDQELSIDFELSPSKKGAFVGYGAYFQAPAKVSCTIVSENGSNNYTLSAPDAPNWGKLGSMWISNGDSFKVTAVFRATSDAAIGLWGAACGEILHRHLQNSRSELLKNMHQFSPEANFYTKSGQVNVRAPVRKGRVSESARPRITLKSCNRCGRFLPINLDDEQKHLSFSNHCKAANRRPCKHGTFGKLRNVETDEMIKLDFGFQLECRFCKKYEVNAAHNPQRTAAQMKEDGARRRSFETLLAELYGESAQLRYRHKTGSELSDDVWDKFNRACFKCNAPLPKARDMALDHTRPLALLWPLDGTATALCGSCNSEKRDRPPAQFYDPQELKRLAKITMIPLAELLDPSPNRDALKRLRSRLDWFFAEFLNRQELIKVRDGKTAAELLVKAVDKAISACPPSERYSLQGEYEKRGRRKR
jgi:hypothetical protein